MFTKEEMVSCLSEYFREKADTYRVDLAFLFGSHARGYLKEESDVDIAVVFEKEIKSEEEMFDLVTNLSVELGFKLNREVDVIPIQEDFRKPMLYYNAVVLGVPVYIKDKTHYAQVYNQALFQMNDFENFGCRWQLEAARNILKGVSHG